MDAEKLISLVQDNPILYATSHPDYIRTKLKDQIWETIGSELNSEGEIVKDQWRKLRECHREALRRQKKKGEQRADPPKPWVYQHQMEFLMPFMKNRATSFNLSTNTINEQTRSMNTDDPDDPTENEGDELEEIEKIDAYETPVSKKVKRTGNQITVRRFLENYEKRATHRDELRQKLLQTCETPKDALYQFFIAMYSATKQLPVTYQRQVRNKIVQVVSEAEELHESVSDVKLSF